MKIIPMMVVVFAASTWLHAAEPEGFALWKGSVLSHYAGQLAGKVDDQKFAWQPLGTYDNHSLGIAHREGDGTAELHETQVDIWIVESGEATLVLGGTIVDPKTVKPHEVRGPAIKGGATMQLSPGDIVHIPANVPHQLKIAKTFTYRVIKVDTK
jgi:mannose-6-phosphate isomerase-like protein (cupin superfamily)